MPKRWHRRQHRARRWRHWRDDTGMVNMAGALPPHVGVPLVNRLEAETDRIRRAARRQGSDEPRAAHMADALVGLLLGQGKSKARGTERVVVCDPRAWRRGRAESDEVCHVIGRGSVPVSVAKELAADSFLKPSSTTECVSRPSPTSAGAYPPSSALLWISDLRRGWRGRAVPRRDVDGATAWSGITGSSGQWRGHLLCEPPALLLAHHRAKTERDREAGLLGGGGGGRPPP
jgi:hypothetical protein